MAITLKRTDIASNAGYTGNPSMKVAESTLGIILTPGYLRYPDASKSHYWLYALLLEDNKIYIGMTSNKNPMNRINMHGDVFGASWTRDHKPVRILEIIDIGITTKEAAENMENDLTIAYMDNYGMQNVRGGRMTTTGLIFRKTKNLTETQDYFSNLLAGIVILGSVVLYILFFIYTLSTEI